MWRFKVLWSVVLLVAPYVQGRMMPSEGYSYLPPDDGGFDKDGESSGPPINIIKMESNLNKDGSYNYEYESENGINVQEMGYPKDIPGAKHPTIVAEGSFSYVSPEGKSITLTYTADEKGFRPVGDHLPTPPPIPPEIAEALAHLPPCDGGEDDEPPSNGGYVYK